MADPVKLSKRTVDAIKAGAARAVVWDTEIPGFGVRVSPNGRKVYVLKYRVGGGRSGRVRWAVIGTHGAITADQARDQARAWAADVATGGDPAQDKQDRRAAPTVAELLDDYLRDHVRVKNKPRTVAFVEDLVKRIIRPELGKLKVAEVTRADVARFHARLSDRPTTANRAAAVLSKAFALAETWGYRPDASNPCRGLDRFAERSRERFLSPAEFAALGEALTLADREPLAVVDKDGKPELRRDGSPRMAMANPRAVAAIRLLIFTGARVSEILGLRWEMIDLDAGRANLPDSKTGKKAMQLAAPALEVLAALGRPEDGKGFVIRGADGADPERPLVNLKDSWSLIRHAARLDDVRLHDLRHAFASVAVAAGMNLPLIGALLGHREVRTTGKYAHLADDPQRAAADVIAGKIAGAMKGAEGGAEVVPLRKIER